MTTPSQVLNDHEVLTLEQCAYVLGLLYRRQGPKKGTPNPLRVVALIEASKLRLVDDSQSRRYWTISASEVRRYLDGGARRPRTIGAAS